MNAGQQTSEEMIFWQTSEHEDRRAFHRTLLEIRGLDESPHPVDDPRSWDSTFEEIRALAEGAGR